MFHWFYKGLPINNLCFVKEYFVNKKALNMLDLTLLSLLYYAWAYFELTYRYAWAYFSRSRCYLLKGRWAGSDGACNKKGYVEYIKIFIWEEVLINGNEGNGWQSFLRIGTAPIPPAIRLHRVYLLYRHLIFSWLAFSCSYCAFQEKIEPSWRKYLIWATD